MKIKSNYLQQILTKKQTKEEKMEKKLENSQRTKCEIWTRVMGYCRPVSSFNKGKKSEFYERQYFTEDKAISSLEALNCSCCEKVA